MNTRAWIEKTQSGRYQVRHIDALGKKFTDYGGIDSKLEANKLRDIVRNRIKSERLGEIDLKKDILHLAHEFIDAKEVDRRPENSLNHYRASFFSFIRDTNVTHLSDVSRDLILGWKSTMYKQGLAPSTIRGRLSDVRTWLNWMVESKYLIVSPFGKKLMPPKVEPEPRYYTAAEFKALDHALSEIDPFTRILCNLAHSGGLRKKEAVAALWEDIQWSKEGADLIIWSKTSKNNKARTIPLDLGVVLLLGSRKSGRLLGDRTRCSADHYFQRARDKARISDKLTIHGLRHTFAKNYLQSGQGNLASLKVLLGHKDINSTMIYAQFEKNYLREGIEKAYEARKIAESVIDNDNAFPKDVGQL